MVPPGDNDNQGGQDGQEAQAQKDGDEGEDDEEAQVEQGGGDGDKGQEGHAEQGGEGGEEGGSDGGAASPRAQRITSATSGPNSCRVSRSSACRAISSSRGVGRSLIRS
jgi:hypothetical protein